MTPLQEVTQLENHVVALRERAALDALLERPIDERTQAEIHAAYLRLSALNHREVA